MKLLSRQNTSLASELHPWNFFELKIVPIGYPVDTPTHVFVATKVCTDKTMFVTTNICVTKVLWRQKDVFQHDKHMFVATKMILLVAPANDTTQAISSS